MIIKSVTVLSESEPPNNSNEELTLELGSHHQMMLRVIYRTPIFEVVLHLAEDAVDITDILLIWFPI